MPIEFLLEEAMADHIITIGIGEAQKHIFEKPQYVYRFKGYKCVYKYVMDYTVFTSAKTKLEIENAVNSLRMLVFAVCSDDEGGIEIFRDIAEFARDKVPSCITAGILVFDSSYSDNMINVFEMPIVADLKGHVDILIPISSNKMSDEFLIWPAKALLYPNCIGFDFADLTVLFRKGGIANFGVGQSVGNRSACRALENALNDMSLGEPIENAKRILVIYSTRGERCDLHELNLAYDTIRSKCHSDAIVYCRTSFDEKLNKDEVVISVIAADFEYDEF